MSKFTTCLWFDGQAEQAASFYRSVFPNTRIGQIVRYGKSGAKVSGQSEGAVMTVEFVIEDLQILGLNGGPLFKFTPALSFSVACSSHDEIKTKWAKLSEGGKVRMGLDKYPWAEQYGWTTDKFGVEWQLILAPSPHKIVPSFLFVDALFGRGEEALNHYLSIFPNSKIESIARDEKKKTIMHASFTLDGHAFALMEGEGTHGYTFNEATSIIVNCKDQNEIDLYWTKLLEGGGEESQCGWLKDKFGVSWQVSPKDLPRYMSDPATAEKAMSAILKMKKIDIATIERAIA